MTTTTPHTPGPWAVNICNENGPSLDSFYLSTAAQTWDGNEEERIVCRFPTGTGQFSDTGRENLANARLIAAAPQMLEALRAALEAMGDTYDARDAAGTEGEQLRDQIAEAIAAATGEPADY
jgi:hypothetical protein